jgi:nucleotide-binding universal stress UspA family protein
MKDIQETEVPIRRILVPLDASLHARTALEAAVEIAAELNAELLGLFVEDINLLRAAEFPFAREVSGLSCTLRPLELRQLEAQLRAQAAELHGALAAVAERKEIPYSFRVIRGSVGSELVKAMAEADLTIMGRLGRSLTGRLGSTVRMIISQGRGLTLILQHGHRLIVPIMVVYDGSPSSRKALSASINLGRVTDGHLLIFVLAETRESAQELTEQVSRSLEPRGIVPDFHVLVNQPLSRLIHLVQGHGNGPLVLPAGKGMLSPENILTLVDRIQNPVLVVS